MTATAPLNIRQYGLRSLWYHRRVNLAVMLGMIVGTAVLTGALIVGDSVRYSLRRLTLERLGRIDEILLADHFFSADLADNFALTAEPSAAFPEAVPVILLAQTTVEKSSIDAARRVGQVTLVGADANFWRLSDAGPKPRVMPTQRQIVLNQALADDVQAQVGDRVIVRLPKATQIAGDSPLGEKVDRVQSLAELEVIEILPVRGLGRFSLRANQALPRTAFLDTQVLQQALDQPGKVNTVLFAGPNADQAPSDSQVAALRQGIRPTLEDAGLRLKPVSLDYWPAGAETPSSTLRYLSLSTETMMFAAAAEAAVEAALSGLEHQAVLTYLANSISAPDDNDSASPSIPYSTVSALSDNATLTPLASINGPRFSLADEDIVLNQWAADDLAVQPGERIRLSYFAPETTHGEAIEESHDFTLKAIVPLQTPELPYRRGQPARYTQPPSRANDPDLTPEVPGITDQESIDAWDPPFPFDYKRIRQPQDEDYWDQFRTTPKAFVNMRAGQRLWGSRFGQITSFRIRATADTFGDATAEAEVRQRLTSAIANAPEAFGFALLHVKQDGLRASQGTTPFNALFLGFSFFIIAAALMLVSLLFRLSLERRASEAGLLLSLGLKQRQVAKVFLFEGLALTLLGTLAGTLLGIGYAGLMIFGLRTWWLDAVVTPFLELHVGRFSLPLGALIGAATSLLTILWTLSGLRKISLRDLLAQNIEPTSMTRRHRRTPIYAAISLWIIALIAAVAAVFLRGEVQAGAFFSAGASVLIAILLQVSWWLKRPTGGKESAAARFHVTPDDRAKSRPQFSSQHADLGSDGDGLLLDRGHQRVSPSTNGTGHGRFSVHRPDRRLALRRPKRSARAPGPAGRVRPNHSEARRSMHFACVDGDDASCRNLYQAHRPRDPRGHVAIH